MKRISTASDAYATEKKKVQDNNDRLRNEMRGVKKLNMSLREQESEYVINYFSNFVTTSFSNTKTSSPCYLRCEHAV